MYDIQKSKSKSDIESLNEVDDPKTKSGKRGSKSEETPKLEKKDLIGAVKDKVTSGLNNVKDTLKRKSKKDADVKKSEKQPEIKKEKSSQEKDNNQSYQDLMEQRRQENKEKMERMKMSKKLDEVFGVIRSESIDDIKKTEITVRGMGNINLNRGKIKKSEVEHNKMDEYDQKRAARQQIAMPDKPATYKKPKKSPPKSESPPKPEPPKEPTPQPQEEPEPVEPPKPVETPKPKKKTTFVLLTISKLVTNT